MLHGLLSIWKDFRHILQTGLVLVEMAYSIDSSRHMNHASRVSIFVNLLYKLMKHGSTGKYKGTLLMTVTQDDNNNNIFPIAFSLVEGETAGG